MYVIAGEFKTVPFSDLAKSRHPIATSFGIKGEWCIGKKS
jgi:hypothetical protein